MDEIYARSQHSIDYAKKFFKCPISFIPDMAFLMKSSKLREKKNIVIVDYRAIADNNDLLISDLKSIIKEFLSLGYSVELYYQVKSDMEDMLTLYDVLRIDGVTMRKDILWYDDIENYYSDKSFVISNRLHSLIFGAVYGVLPIARITEDSHLAKIMHVFRNSLPEVFYNNMEIMSQLDVRELVENEDLYRGNLNSYMINNKKKCSDIIEKIVSYLT